MHKQLLFITLIVSTCGLCAADNSQSNAPLPGIENFIRTAAGERPRGYAADLQAEAQKAIDRVAAEKHSQRYSANQRAEAQSATDDEIYDEPMVGVPQAIPLVAHKRFERLPMTYSANPHGGPPIAHPSRKGKYAVIGRGMGKGMPWIKPEYSRDVAPSIPCVQVYEGDFMAEMKERAERERAQMEEKQLSAQTRPELSRPRKEDSR